MGKFVGTHEWEELARAAGFRCSELARLCRLSTRQLRRQIRRQFGRSPQDWLNEHRIIAAQQLLLNGHLVKTVALELGFKQTSHFCRQFKLLRRMTPSEFVSLQSKHRPPIGM
jgi:AraC-like DNA-binding protein